MIHKLIWLLNHVNCCSRNDNVENSLDSYRKAFDVVYLVSWMPWKVVWLLWLFLVSKGLLRLLCLYVYLFGVRLSLSLDGWPVQDSNPERFIFFGQSWQDFLLTKYCDNELSKEGKYSKSVWKKLKMWE